MLNELLVPAPTALIEEIEASFAQAEYPGDDRLVNDTGGYHLEANDIAEAFRGKHWREIELAFLFPHRQSLFFFTPEAFRFYLPAYLLACLRADRMATDVRESVIYSLTVPDGPGRDMDWLVKRIDPLTKKQKESIEAFFIYLDAFQSHRFSPGEIRNVLERFKVVFLT